MVLFLSSCAEEEVVPEPVVESDIQFLKGNFETLSGWSQDHHGEALAAFRESCGWLVRKKPTVEGIEFSADSWADICAVAAEKQDNPKAFFETYFDPYLVKSKEGEQGLFTGYYEMELLGSRQKTERFDVPLYKRPDDLITVDLGLFDETLKGKRVFGKVYGTSLKLYPERADIDQGYLKDKNLELIWLEDPIDTFLLHIQGSAVVRFEDGQQTRVGYAAKNGQPYASVGREMIRRKLLPRDGLTADVMRDWLQEHPDIAPEILHANKSYIFFRELPEDLADAHGPQGSIGVSLTPQRSLAVDPDYIPYAVPVWLDADHPVDRKKRLQKLMVAQDTGSAIKGVIRGDFFWGTGTEAGFIAGQMKSRGTYHILLPKVRRYAQES